MNIQLPEQQDVFAYGFDRFLNREPASVGSAYSAVTDPTAPAYGSQSLVALQGSSIIRSGNYVAGQRGYQIDSNGDFEIGNIIFNRDVVMSWFESMDGWTVASGGSGTLGIRLGSAYFSTGATTNSFVSIQNDNLTAAPCRFFTKDSMFNMTVEIPKLTGSAYIAQFGVGDMVDDLTIAEGYGFKIYNDVLTAMTWVAGVETTAVISGIEIGNSNTYLAKNDVKAREVRFYVNRQLVATRPVVFTNQMTECRFSIKMRNTTTASRELQAVNAVFAQDK